MTIKELSKALGVEEYNAFSAKCGGIKNMSPEQKNEYKRIMTRVYYRNYYKSEEKKQERHNYMQLYRKTDTWKRWRRKYYETVEVPRQKKKGA